MLTLTQPLTLGEAEGHPFRGNQYTDGEGSSPPPFGDRTVQERRFVEAWVRNATSQRTMRDVYAGNPPGDSRLDLLRRQAARDLATRVVTAPPVPYALHRLEHLPVSRVAALQPGASWSPTSTLSSFSSDESVPFHIKYLADHNMTVQSSQGGEPVIFHVEPGAVALPVHVQGFSQEAEVISGGTFTVISREEFPAGPTQITVRQDAPPPPPPPASPDEAARYEAYLTRQRGYATTAAATPTDHPALAHRSSVRPRRARATTASSQPLAITFGDVEGHPFHGNQWTEGVDAGDELADQARSVEWGHANQNEGISRGWDGETTISPEAFKAERERAIATLDRAGHDGAAIQRAVLGWTMGADRGDVDYWRTVALGPRPAEYPNDYLWLRDRYGLDKPGARTYPRFGTEEGIKAALEVARNTTIDEPLYRSVAVPLASLSRFSPGSTIETLGVESWSRDPEVAWSFGQPVPYAGRDVPVDLEVRGAHGLDTAALGERAQAWQQEVMVVEPALRVVSVTDERETSTSPSAGLRVVLEPVAETASAHHLEFGDVPGHVFHGNQWTGGLGEDVPSEYREVHKFTSEHADVLREHDAFFDDQFDYALHTLANDFKRDANTDEGLRWRRAFAEEGGRDWADDVHPGRGRYDTVGPDEVSEPTDDEREYVQEWLTRRDDMLYTEHGQDLVTVYRGTAGGDLEVGQVGQVPVNALSSWSLDPATATDFGTVYKAQVELRDIVWADRSDSEVEVLLYSPEPTREAVRVEAPPGRRFGGKNLTAAAARGAPPKRGPSKITSRSG